MVLGGGLLQVPLIKRVKQKGYRVFLADYYENPPGRRYCDEASQISSVSIDDNLRYAEERDINYILTIGTDQPVLTAATVSEKLGLPHPISAEQGMMVTNKLYMKRIMVENGIPTPGYKVLRSFGDVDWQELSFPLVMKPADSQGQRGIFVLRGQESLEKLQELFVESIKHSTAGAVLLEDFYPGDEITANCWVKAGIGYTLMITDRLHFDDSVALGICKQQRFPSCAADGHVPEIEQLVQKIVDAFRISDGPLYIQMMVGALGPQIIEFGFRIGGGFESETIPRVTGVDILELYTTLVTEGKNIFNPDELQLRIRHGSIFFMLARPGIARKIHLPEEFKDGGFLFIGENDEIGAIENATSRVGCFYFYTDSDVEYRYLLNRFNAELAVYDENNEDLLYHDIWE